LSVFYSGEWGAAAKALPLMRDQIRHTIALGYP